MELSPALWTLQTPKKEDSHREHSHWATGRECGQCIPEQIQLTTSKGVGMREPATAGVLQEKACWGLGYEFGLHLKVGRGLASRETQVCGARCLLLTMTACRLWQLRLLPA